MERKLRLHFGITHGIQIILDKLKFYTYKSVKPKVPEVAFNRSYVQCNFSTNEAQSLKEHVRARHAIIQFAKTQQSSPSSLDKDNQLKTHTREKLHRCAFCSFKSAWKCSLEGHVRTHTGEKPFRCSQCSHTAAHQSDIKEHAISRHPNPTQAEAETRENPQSIIPCPTCARSFCSRKRLKSHMRVHSDDRPYACKLCLYSAKTRPHLNRHTLSHTGEKPIPCPLCPYATTNRSDLHLHLRTHTGEKPFSCPYCDHRTACKANLKLHYRTKHFQGTLEPTFECPICLKKAFHTKSKLNRHLLVHTGERYHRCRFCQKEFAHAEGTRKHERLYCKMNPKMSDPNWVDQRKGFKCDLCDHSTGTMGHLKVHRRTHTGETPYQCLHCSKGLKSKASQDLHEKVCKLNPNQSDPSWKEKQRVFKCELCPYSTIVGGNFSRHVKTHSRKEP